MGLGAKYQNSRLGCLSKEQSKLIEFYIDQIAENIKSGVGLFLWGANSTGKTYIGSALCKYVWGKYRVGSYLVTAADLYECWIEDRPCYEGSSTTVLERSANIRFLVIDDLGREYRANSGFAESKFGALLRRRVANNRTTIITSQLSPGEFADIYGEAVKQLAKESLISVQLEASNYREKIQKELRNGRD